MFRLKLMNIGLEWDNDYGCHHRTGWTITIYGIICADLEKYFLVAIYKAFKTYWFSWDAESRRAAWQSK